MSEKPTRPEREGDDWLTTKWVAYADEMDEWLKTEVLPVLKESLAHLQLTGLSTVEDLDGLIAQLEDAPMTKVENYREPVTFTKTNLYGCGPDSEDDVYTVEEFKACVESGAFIDYDGFGHPVKDSMADPTVVVYPSRVSEIPSDATHIVWYNK